MENTLLFLISECIDTTPSSGANRKGNLVSRQLYEIRKELSNNSDYWLIAREFHTGRVSEGYRSSTVFSIRFMIFFLGSAYHSRARNPFIAMRLEWI
jgi:hypothetical protein